VLNDPTEHQEQVALVSWLRATGRRYFAVPNGGRRDARTAGALKAEGVSAGAPDLIVFLHNGLTLALEMKARRSGRASEAQKEWGAYLEARPGWKTLLAHGAREAVDGILRLDV
jgi:hypothetical protein